MKKVTILVLLLSFVAFAENTVSCYQKLDDSNAITCETFRTKNRDTVNTIAKACKFIDGIAKFKACPTTTASGSCTLFTAVDGKHIVTYYYYATVRDHRLSEDDCLKRNGIYRKN